MIIVSGWLRVDEDARGEYLAGCEQVVRLAREAPGCLDFALSADLLDPGRINVYERWESGEAVEAFRGTGPDAGRTATIRDAEVLRYEISATGPA